MDELVVVFFAVCPLVSKLCNISSHTMVEGCFFHPFFTFSIFIQQSL